MSVTPIAGNYAVIFNADLFISTNGRFAQVSFYKAGAIITDSTRTEYAHGNNDNLSASSISYVTFNGSQLFELKMNTNSISASLNNRSILLIRTS